MKNVKNFALIAALALGLTACGGGNNDKADNASTEAPAAEEKVGTAEAEGYSGKPIKVTVTMEGDKIKDIQRESEDTDNIGEVAMDELTDKMIKENNADVDNVSGATKSSEAFKTAVKEAIANAK
jgi:uncharacterized protein with FMN-binding domain